MPGSVGRSEEGAEDGPPRLRPGRTGYNREDEAPQNLEKGGYLALECDWRQCNGIRERLVKKGYLGVNIVKDLRGLDRVVYGRYDG